MHKRARFGLGAAASLFVILSSAQAFAGTETCQGWSAGLTWDGPAYATMTASLYTAGGALVENSTNAQVQAAAGTMTFSGTWVSTPLNGTYQVLFNATVYGDLNHTPTPAELASWPSNLIFHVSGTSDQFACTCTGGTHSSNASNFNGTPIGAGDTIWFSAVFKVNAGFTGPVTFTLQESTITFAGTSVSVPNARITIDPAATTAASSFDSTTNTWVTVVPPNTSGNIFLDGVPFHVPAGGLPGGITPVTWAGTFSANRPGLPINWAWSAAVYSSFAATAGGVSVKAVDDNHFQPYPISDHAGTPENYRSSVIGGARGGGGSNFTGSLSGTLLLTPSPCD
jgi:hypothetical protein